MYFIEEYGKAGDRKLTPCFSRKIELKSRKTESHYYIVLLH